MRVLGQSGTGGAERQRRHRRVAGTPLAWAAAILALSATGCGDPGSCIRCETLVIAATNEPGGLIPPLVGETVGRDVSDLIFERLARLPGGAAPLDSSAYQPGLAVRWERIDSTSLRFRLRPGARWHDGTPVTAGDVAFSFQAYLDSTLASPFRSALEGVVGATAADDSTVLIRFQHPDPEQWYLATWHVRILPKHVWDTIPLSRWESDTLSAHLVGSGPYRLERWVKGQSLSLVRVSDSRDAPAIRQVIWRFSGAGEAALNLLLSHEADLIESAGDSSRVARIRADSALTTIGYPSAVYGFLGFHYGAPPASPLRSREVRRALALATDRATVAQGVFGPGAIAPPGPMSRILWIYQPSLSGTPYDPAAAERLLDQAGWRRQGTEEFRRRNGRRLSVDILVPGTSLTRRNLAQVLQEMWRKAGVRVTVTTVDFPVFQERLRTGRFESFIGAWLDEPSPRHLLDQWSSSGIGNLNYTRYRNPVMDSLLDRAVGFRGSPEAARAAWHEALDTLNADVPAIWLYNPTQLAGVNRRLEGVTIDPYSWLAGLPTWRLSP